MKNELKPLTAMVPACVDADRLVEGTNLKADRVRLLLHQLYVAKFFGNDNDDGFNQEGWVNLSAVRLKRLLTKNYTRYEELLERNGIIDIQRTISGGKSYVNGEFGVGRCARYRLNKRFLVSAKNKFKKEKITDKTTLTSIANDRKKFQMKVMKGEVHNLRNTSKIHQALADMLNQFRFETEGLQDFIQQVEFGTITLKTPVKQGFFDQRHVPELINEDNAGQPVVCKFGERFHSPHTRLPAPYRAFLRIRGSEENLASVDIKNSQPFMLSLIVSFPDQVSLFLPEFKPVL